MAAFDNEAASGPRSMVQDLAPYAGGETDAPGNGGSSTAKRGMIPEDDKHSNATPGGVAAVREDITPYAGTNGPNQARDESAKQVNDRNTNRCAKDAGETVDTGVFTDDSSLQVPGSVEPYAGESRMVAAQRDADGL